MSKATKSYTETQKEFCTPAYHIWYTACSLSILTSSHSPLIPDTPPYSSPFLSSPPTLLPVIGDTVKQNKTGEQGFPTGKERQCPKNPVSWDNLSILHTSFIFLSFRLVPWIIHSLWTGLFSAAARPLCTCWQPLWILSAWPVDCPPCGELAPSPASHPFPSSTTPCGRTRGLPPGSSRGQRRVQSFKMSGINRYKDLQWGGETKSVYHKTGMNKAFAHHVCPLFLAEIKLIWRVLWIFLAVKTRSTIVYNLVQISLDGTLIRWLMQPEPDQKSVVF